jgi:RHS repeat-associated protein
MEGAGGIGGILARTDYSAAAAAVYEEGPSYFHSDGNGNVTMLINGAQAVVAKYLYDAFGNTLSAAGSLASANLYRFSSKEAHPNSGLVYYLYRYYDPNLQRWPNRDPLTEPGFERLTQPHLVRAASHIQSLREMQLLRLGDVNLYRFALNDPVLRFDPFGLEVNGCAALAAAAYAAYSDGDMATYAQINDLMEQLGCFDPPPVPTPPVYCPDIPPIANPEHNRTFCQAHPTICAIGTALGEGAVAVGTGIRAVATFCEAFPWLCAAAGAPVGL